MKTSDIGGGSGSAKGTETKKPAAWSAFPDYEKFWGAFVDTFWGISGGTPYHEILTEDIEWLKKAYLQNNESLTKLESDYINELKGSQVGLRFGGGPAINLLPKSSKFIAEEKLRVGGTQAKRITDFAKDFTPNRANREYMEYLRQLGTEGQNLRQGLPTTTEKGTAKKDTSILENIGTAVEIGKGLSDLYGAGKDVGAWDWISDWWE